MEPVTVATSDPVLLEAALRWCAAAGLEADAVSDTAVARARWRTAPLVLLGDDLVPSVVAAAPPRRDRVLLVVHDPDDWWREAVALGAASVLAAHDDARGVAAVSYELDGGAEGCSIAVVPGSGGVGASTLAAALAGEAVRRGLRSLAVDGDPRGAGLELVLGAEHATGLRWGDLDAAGGHVSAESLADALPRHHGVATLAWPATDDTVTLPPTAGAVWSAATRGFDFVVVDLPGADGGWAASVAGGSVLTVLVVADDVVGIAAARRRLADLRTCGASVVAVVASRRSGVGAEAVERTLGCPVVARLRPDRRLRVAVDHGAGPRSRSLRRATSAVLDLVGLSTR